jgi:hypothetical protein
MYCERFDRGEEIRSYHRILTSENKWLAARYGLEAPLMDLATEARNRVPVAQLVRRRLKELEPHAKELGSEDALDGIPRDPLSGGNGADQPGVRLSTNANRDVAEVARAKSLTATPKRQPFPERLTHVAYPRSQSSTKSPTHTRRGTASTCSYDSEKIARRARVVHTPTTPLRHAHAAK